MKAAGALLAVLAALALAAPALARAPIDFAAGEEMAGQGDITQGVPPDAFYWTADRDLSVYTDELWDLLAAEQVPISVHLRYGRDFGPVPAGMPAKPDGVPLLREALERGVPVTAWIVVPFGPGYWAHEGNTAIMEEAVHAFADWADANDLHAEKVLIDLELSIQDTAVVGKTASNPLGTLLLFQRNVGPAKQCAAMRAYEGLAAFLHSRGYRVSAAVVPFLLDDVVDGNLGLSDAMGMPAIRPGHFDELGFMTMRGVFTGLIGLDPGPSLQASYFRDARKYYGPAAGLTLGVAGEGPYASLANLIEDVRTAATLGGGPIGVYSLEKTVKAFGIEGLRQVIAAASAPFTGADARRVTTISPVTAFDRLVFRLLDIGTLVGTPLGTLTNGSGTLALPNAYPPRCA